MHTATVIIADDHVLVREGVKSVLAKLESIEVVAEAGDGIEAIALTKTHSPDLLLLDVSMPHANGIEVLEEVRRWSPSTRVIILTAVTASSLFRQALDLGAAGLLLKADDGGELIAAIPKVLAGNIVVSESLQGVHHSAGFGSQLTRRETQVLHGLARGETNAAIGERLGISPSTVNNHRANIMRKLDVHSVAELLSAALKEGLLDSGTGA